MSEKREGAGSATRRVCYECKHLIVDPGWGGSDVTPGDGIEVSCTRGHFFLGEQSINRMSLWASLEKAGECPDFTIDEGRPCPSCDGQQRSSSGGGLCKRCHGSGSLGPS